MDAVSFAYAMPEAVEAKEFYGRNIKVYAKCVSIYGTYL